MDIDIDYIYIYIYNNPKTQNINLTQKPKSKPTQQKYPKLTHKFIIKSKEKKKAWHISENKNNRKKSIQTFKICCCKDELGQRMN